MADDITASDDGFGDDEVIDVNDVVAEDSTEEQQEDESTKDESGADDSLEDDDSLDDTNDEPNTEDEPEADEAKEEEDSESDEDTQKQRAREEYEARQRERAERKAKTKESLAKWVEDEDTTDLERRVRAQEAREYLTTVERNEERLLNEYDKVMRDDKLSVFHTGSPEYNEKLFARELANYEATKVQFNDNGDPLAVHGSFYDHLKEAADLYSEGQKTGERRGQAAEAKLRNKAVTPTSTGNTSSSEDDDPFLKGFNSPLI